MDDQSTHQVEGQTESGEPKRLGFLGWCFWASILLLVYFLSSCPVERLADEGLLPPAFVTVYGPIKVLRFRSKPFERFYIWYWKLWNPERPGALAKQSGSLKSSSFASAKRPDPSGLPPVKYFVLG